MKHLALTIVSYAMFAASQSIPALALLFWLSTLFFAFLTAYSYLNR